MAIDTVAKRGSALGVAVIGMAVIWPDANDLELPQRLASNGLYAGIAAAETGSGLRPLRKWLVLRPFHLGF